MEENSFTILDKYSFKRKNRYNVNNGLANEKSRREALGLIEPLWQQKTKETVKGLQFIVLDKIVAQHPDNI